MYYFFHVLGFLGAAAYIFVFAPKYGFKRCKTLVLTVLTYASIYALMLVLFYFITGKFGGQNIVRVFMFVPPVAMLYGAAMSMKTSKVLDLVAPVPCIVHGISHIGCLFPGCCYSCLRVDWGIYNRKVGTTLFPVQIFEAVTALAIAVAVIIIAKRCKYDCRGRTMPLMLMLFGVTRFGWEFLRDNDKLFWSISDLALWAAATAVIGAVWLTADAIISKNLFDGRR